MKQMIWSSYDLLDETAKEEYQNSQREILDDDSYEVSDEEWAEEVYCRLDDERSNLNKEVDGIIVVFGNLGLWNGRRRGYQILGSTIADILKSQCAMQNGTATATTFADGWTIMTVRTIPYTVSPKAVTKRNVSPIRFTTVKSTKKASAGEHVPSIRM